MYSYEINQLLTEMYQTNRVLRKEEVDIRILHTLIDNKHIYPCSEGFVIADAGVAYIEALLNSEEEAKKENFHRWFNTLLASAALLVGIISLFL